MVFCVRTQDVMADICPVSIDGYHDEADQGDDKRKVRSGDVHDGDARVNDESLEWWKHRTAQNGHDKSGTSKLDVVAYVA